MAFKPHRPVPSRSTVATGSRGVEAPENRWIGRYLEARAMESAGEIGRAITILEEVVAAAPDERAPRYDLGILYGRVRRYPEALRALYDVAKRFPNDGTAALEVAKVLHRMGQHQLALTFVNRALTLDRANLVAMMTLAEISKALGAFTESRDIYAAALAIAPDNATLHNQYGMTLAMLGEWLRGWEEMEHREAVFGTDFLYGALPDTPRWDGQAPLAGKRLLVLHEQGLGDSIMAVRFARQLSAQGAIVHFRTLAPLLPLVEAAPGVAECSVHGTPYPDHDLHLPLMSLMHALAVTPASLDGAPYLAPQGDCPPRIATLLDAPGAPVVALAWSGNPAHDNDANRSIRGELLAPLLGVTGIRFVALQVAPPAADVLPVALHDRILDLGAQCHTFNDSAHALRRVDLLITVDTSVAHLAGALGVPTLLCLPYVPDYRWGLGGTTTPWYDSVTLLRQQQPSGWPGVLENVRLRLEQLRDRD